MTPDTEQSVGGGFRVFNTSKAGLFILDKTKAVCLSTLYGHETSNTTEASKATTITSHYATLALGNTN